MLISSIQDFRKFIPIDANTNLSSIQPHIEDAERRYIVPLLGQDLYDELTDALSNPPPDEDFAVLLPFSQRPLAYYAQMLAIPHLAATFGDLGIRQHRGEDSDVAPRWLQEKLQFNALRHGDIYADELLAFLEAKAGDDKYASWYNSDANTKNSGFIVYSTQVASRHIDIGESRRIFLRIRPNIREIEQRIIPKLIGPAQYADLVSKLKAGTIADESPEAKLIALLEPIICKRALYLRLPFLRFTLGDQGIFLYSPGISEIQPAQLASDADVKALRHQLMDGELGYLRDEEELRQYLLSNIDNYPLVKASGVYTAQPDPGPTWQPNNNESNKYFAV